MKNKQPKRYTFIKLHKKNYNEELNDLINNDVKFELYIRFIK
jgi:hypothetical protein